MNGELAAAARIVGRVLRDGAYSNRLLGQAEDPAGRVRALVHGTLRRLPAIDAALAVAAQRDLDQLEAELVDLLRVAVADLEAGDPPPLVVHAAVEAVKQTRPRAAGLANAVLRRVASEGVPTGPGPELAWGIPPWLAQTQEQAWGRSEAAAFWEASNRPASRTARIRPGATAPPGARPVEGIPGSWRLAPGPLPEGAVIQDPASTAVGLAARPEPGQRVLEVGAAPGGKTLHLVDQLGGSVVAVDAHPRRTRTARRRVPEANWVLADGQRPPFPPASFDLVLIDAPCSGLGTLRRRPELRYRVSPDEVTRLGDLQAALVDACLPLVAPGGRLVYAVCTVTPTETVDVVAERGFRPPSGLPGRRWADGWLLAPHLCDTDGMFVAEHHR